MTAGRATALRMIFGSVGGAAYELTTAETACTSPLPLSRRIGVVAVEGGCGTSAVATALSSVLARRRSGPVLGVDAAAGRSGLLRRTAAAGQGTTQSGPPGDPDTAAAVRAAARTTTDATTGLPRSATGAFLLDLAGPSRRAASVADWSVNVSPIGRFFDLVVTDWGVRPPAVDLAAAAETSHVLVMVGRADRRSATAAGSALAALRADDAQAAAALLVLVDVARTADRIVGPLGRALDLDVQVLPHEPRWSDDPAATRRRFGSRTRRAHIALAVAVMGEAARSQQPMARASSRVPAPAGTAP